jgi:hypothetical protein
MVRDAIRCYLESALKHGELILDEASSERLL